MQGRAFEKYIWSVTFGLCALMLLTDTASASTGEGVLAVATNPVVYVIGLVGTFVGCKIFISTGAQF